MHPPTKSPTISPTPNPTSTPTLTNSPTSSVSPTGIYDWCEDLDKQFSIESIRWIRNKKNWHWASQKIWLRCAFDKVVANCPLVCDNCHCTDNKKHVEIEIIMISYNNNPNSGKVRYSSIEYYQSTIESEASTIATYN
jgi:hypothetical protein